MIVKIPLCLSCAARLRAVRDAQGERAMISRMGEILCDECLRNLPGYQPGLRPSFELKARF
jgi:hypothetical protein